MPREMGDQREFLDKNFIQFLRKTVYIILVEEVKDYQKNL